MNSISFLPEQPKPRRFLPYFSRILNLKLDDETMVKNRRKFDYVVTQPNGEKPAGVIDIDANKPLKEVVDEIFGYCVLGPSGDN